MDEAPDVPTSIDPNITYSVSSSRYGSIVCYNQTEAIRDGDQNGWDSPGSIEAFPFFVMQLFFANASYRIIYSLTRPLHLPPFVAQILCGFVFSPTVLGRNSLALDKFFPYRYTMVLETFSSLALVYNMFLLGLGMDLRMIRIKQVKPMVISIVGLVVPLVAGTVLYYLPRNGDPDKILAGCLYWSVALSCTNFPDLARILADLKLLRTEMGHTAMSASIITDLCTWVLLVLGNACFSRGTWNDAMPYALVSTIAFVFFCIYVIHPGIAWAFANTVKGGHVGDTHVWFTLVGVVLCSLITDAFGVQSITGAFLFGLSIPHDHIIRNMIEEKLHYFLSGILMPLFYIVCGLRIDLGYMLSDTSVGMFVFVVSTCFMLKILTTVICSLFLRMPLRDGFALGALMNTKGTMALVILNTGRDSKALDVILYTHMTLAFLVMSVVVQPLLTFTYTPKKQLIFYKYRTVQKLKGEVEFRVLTCVHALSNVSGITNLLHVSNPTKQSPLDVYAIHLVELTGRTTTASLLIMHDESKPKVNFSDRVRAESEQIAEIFEGMEVHNEAVLVQTLTVVSPYATMHEDICTLAEDKRVSLILLPYHKNLTPDGKLGEGNSAHAEVNQNVLSNAPCSVGILVDRGMTVIRSESSSVHAETTKKEVAVLFIGGRDDREALAYAWRMVGQEMVNLTVVRFIPSRDALVSAGKLPIEYAKESQADEEYIYEFNFKTKNDSSVSYTEKVVNDGPETIEAVRDMEDNHSFDIYIVGRGYKVETPVTAGLTDWSSSPDLGTIGDTLAASSFTMHASVLVIQQYSAANRQTSENHQEHVKGGAKTADEAKMNSFVEEDDEDEQYQMGMRK